MGRRQLTLFTIGCWMAVATGVFHLVGQLIGPLAPANDTERTLTELATTYKFALPGGQRSLMQLMNGFSLSFALFFALLGGAGLIVAKRGRHDATLMTAILEPPALPPLPPLPPHPPPPPLPPEAPVEVAASLPHAEGAFAPPPPPPP